MTASASALTRAAERVPHWSSTSRAGARPDRCPALISTPRSSTKTIVMGAQANPIGPTSTRNRTTATVRRLAFTLIAAIKSP